VNVGFSEKIVRLLADPTPKAATFVGLGPKSLRPSPHILCEVLHLRNEYRTEKEKAKPRETSIGDSVKRQNLTL
jgi:hypothetical protein